MAILLSCGLIVAGRPLPQSDNSMGRLADALRSLNMDRPARWPSHFQSVAMLVPSTGALPSVASVGAGSTRRTCSVDCKATRSTERTSHDAATVHSRRSPGRRRPRPARGSR